MSFCDPRADLWLARGLRRPRRLLLGDPGHRARRLPHRGDRREPAGRHGRDLPARLSHRRAGRRAPARSTSPSTAPGRSPTGRWRRWPWSASSTTLRDRRAAEAAWRRAPPSGKARSPNSPTAARTCRPRCAMRWSGSTARSSARSSISSPASAGWPGAAGLHRPVPAERHRHGRDGQSVLHRHGLRQQQIANVTKIYGFVMSILGALLGGALVFRHGRGAPARAVGVPDRRPATSPSPGSPSSAGPTRWCWPSAISIDNLASGMSGSVFIAFLSGLTNTAYTATQYALFSSIMTPARQAHRRLLRPDRRAPASSARDMPASRCSTASVAVRLRALLHLHRLARAARADAGPGRRPALRKRNPSFREEGGAVIGDGVSSAPGEPAHSGAGRGVCQPGTGKSHVPGRGYKTVTGNVENPGDADQPGVASSA